ncbi:MAG: M23 family metallopeptidase [Spirochaetales bacterium]|nr:MAG: M23 family metallopeptidase [Spirochaetales bacterium]
MRTISIFLFMFMWSVARADPSPTVSLAEYPVIRRLAPSDLVFRQLQDAIAQGYGAENGSGSWPDLFLGAWISQGGEDLFSLAARLSLPYETLAGLNGFTNPAPIDAGRIILIPSMAGLFLPEKARNDMDLILSSRLASEDQIPYRLKVTTERGQEVFSFYPGKRLYSTERSFFLNVGFRAPLPRAVFSSPYGMRRSPIDGHDRLHEGIDLAAPAGTFVMAARAGTVVAIGVDSMLGLRIIIEHESGWRTIYGHLERVTVELNQSVLSGTIIAAVGSSGLSTGPHLHFEIRMGVSSRDPSSLLPGISP